MKTKLKTTQPKTRSRAKARDLGNRHKATTATVYPKPAALLGPLDPGRLLKIDEVAARLAVSPATLGRVIKSGGLPVIKVGPRAIRIRPDDLTAYIAKNVRR